LNPVTRRLLERIDDPALADFAQAWDALEACIVRVYRQGACASEDEVLYEELHRRVTRGMGRWEAALESRWREVRIDGQPLPRSPFRTALAVTRARQVIGHWQLMRTLPAAREALNHLLLESGVD
jgi:hypothetical protein